MATYENMCNAAADLMTTPLEFISSIGNIAVECTTTSGGDATISTINTKLAEATTNFLPVLMSLGCALAVCFFIFQLIELTMSERLTLELFIKSFAKVAVAIGLVYMAPQIYNGILEIGTAFATDIANANYLTAGTFKSETDGLADVMIKYCETNGKIFWIQFLVIGVLVGIIALLFGGVLVAVVYVICISRIIELNVRGCLLPIAFGLLADEGWRGAGGRYIRKFLAVACQGAVLALIGKITSACMSIASTKMCAEIMNFDTTVSSLLIAVFMGFALIFGVAIASISAMFKSNQIISDAFGA